MSGQYSALQVASYVGRAFSTFLVNSVILQKHYIAVALFYRLEAVVEKHSPNSILVPAMKNWFRCFVFFLGVCVCGNPNHKANHNCEDPNITPKPAKYCFSCSFVPQRRTAMTVFCCILSQYRGSFNVSNGFGCGLLRRQVRVWYVPPRGVDAWLAYRILCAGLVPVNYLDNQAYEYYCRVGAIVSTIS